MKEKNRYGTSDKSACMQNLFTGGNTGCNKHWVKTTVKHWG